MEDALALEDPKAVKAKDSGVLILVLMEDALAQRRGNETVIVSCLNPCFNGRCTRTCSRYNVSPISYES